MHAYIYEYRSPAGLVWPVLLTVASAASLRGRIGSTARVHSRQDVSKALVNVFRAHFIILWLFSVVRRFAIILRCCKEESYTSYVYVGRISGRSLYAITLWKESHLVMLAMGLSRWIAIDICRLSHSLHIGTSRHRNTHTHTHTHASVQVKIQWLAYLYSVTRQVLNLAEVWIFVMTSSII